jgi:hypothetical protein
MSQHLPSALVVSPELGCELSAIAAGFLAALNERQRGRAQIDFEAPERHDWHYVPRSRPGLPLRDMDASQRAAALALLQVGLSKTGARKALAIMKREKVLKRMEPSEPYDSLDYAFAVYGDPREAPWAWSVEGHHLSLHFTLLSKTEITLTPFFMGVAPLCAHEGDTALDPVLISERDLAFELLHDLDPQDREQAIIADRAMGDILSGPGREESLRIPVGLSVARLADARRDLVLRLLEEYLTRLRRDFEEIERARLREAGIERLHFAWAGALHPGAPHYYRLHGPTLLFEYDNTQDDANHIHTVWHDPGLAFGDALKAHYEKGHTRQRTVRRRLPLHLPPAAADWTSRTRALYRSGDERGIRNIPLAASARPPPVVEARSEGDAGLLVHAQDRFLLECRLVVLADGVDPAARGLAERIEQYQQSRALFDNPTGGITELSAAAQQRQSIRKAWRDGLVDEPVELGVAYLAPRL